LLAETLQSFRCKQDVVHTPEERCSYPEGPCIIVPQTTTVDAFKAFLKRPAFNGAFTDEQVASSFVNGVRNGILPIAGAVYDRWSRGRVHSVYWWGLAARAGRRRARRSARQPDLGARHAVAVRLACTFLLPR
jgi:hypothetical protein